MKQYTTPEQTAKLIELGFAPTGRIKEVRTVHSKVEVSHDCNFTIGELIEMLPNDDITTSSFEYDGFNWYVDWDLFDKIHQTSGVELIDALYAMILKLKEEGVI